MQRKLLTGNAAIAWGVRLASAEYMPVFPITPQTEILETLGRWIDDGVMPGKMVMMDSEHSMITAAGAAAATGVRTFTATSSQGLLYGVEMIYTVAGWRVPLVIVNVSRGLSAPITLEPDHNDIMAVRDSGALQIHASTCQEALDAILLAYRITEDKRVHLPVIVNIDGFYLSFTREPVDIPSEQDVSRFLPAFDPGNRAFRGDQPLSEAVAVLGGAPYSYFRYQAHMACEAGTTVFDEAASEFENIFGRAYKQVDCYKCEEAEVVFVMIGSFATKAMDAVDRLCEAGVKAGLVRPILLRPFPTEQIRKLLKNKKAVAVIDQNISMGKGGVLHTEIESALYGVKGAPKIITGYIGGLGGRDIGPDEFYQIAREALIAADHDEIPSPKLLYLEDELRQIRKLQAIAAVEQEELARKNNGKKS